MKRMRDAESMSYPLRILLVDTETNGLPKNRYAPVTMEDAYPAVLQLSWAVYTVRDKELHLEISKDVNVALHPSVPWNEDAAKIHGISEEDARNGVNAADVLLEFAMTLRSVQVVIAHNLSFDKSVLRAAAFTEWKRLYNLAREEGKEIEFEAEPGYDLLKNLWPSEIDEFCTMMNTTDILRLPNPKDPLRRYKSPRLGELYVWLFQHNYDISGNTLHTSHHDTRCLAKCVNELLQRDLIHLA
jgi:DNA polymerase III epsilon subunit-like protein